MQAGGISRARIIVRKYASESEMNPGLIVMLQEGWEVVNVQCQRDYGHVPCLGTTLAVLMALFGLLLFPIFLPAAVVLWLLFIAIPFNRVYIVTYQHD